MSEFVEIPLPFEDVDSVVVTDVVPVAAPKKTTRKKKAEESTEEA